MDSCFRRNDKLGGFSPEVLVNMFFFDFINHIIQKRRRQFTRAEKIKSGKIREGKGGYERRKGVTTGLFVRAMP
jgi:hypothetical protein